MDVKASLRFAKVGAQKARLVADLVRGKEVGDAIKALSFTDKKTSVLVRKLIESAVANANDRQVLDLDRLYVKTITVDQGPSLKRIRPRAQGRAYGVRKKMSHINVVLAER